MSKEHDMAIERAKSEPKWSTPDEYWEKFLRRNNRADITRIAMNYPQETTIIINLKKVLDNKIDELVHNQKMGKTIEDIKTAALRMLYEHNKDTPHNYPKLLIRFTNVRKIIRISDLRVIHLEQLISIRCLVKRVSEVRPKIIEATFHCNAQNHPNVVHGTFNSVAIPTVCNACKSTRFKHQKGRDVMVNRQFVYVQEPLDELKGGGQPATLKVEVCGDECNTIMVGDRLQINGSYKAIDRNKGDRLDSTKEVYFECNHAEVGIRDYEEVVITQEDEDAIKKLVADGNVFEKITQSIAPSIYGMTLLKQAISLMLFEGVTITMPDGTTIRGQINVLVVTDPGMAKTVLLRFVVSITPRGVFANATTATKVGLIAPVVKDELTGMWAIEAGAYMLANGGVLCLDEIGELSKDDFKSLHEAMENGEVHVTKAGINATVKTAASMLAACNPIKGRFSSYEALAPQVQIPAGVLSRFDVVILMQDVPGAKNDREIAKFITDTHMAAAHRMKGKDVDPIINDMLTPKIPPELLRKYIAFARKIIPVLTPEANEMLVDYYVKIRPNTEIGNTVAVTTRQQPSVIRLAEAHARMRLSETVEIEDATAAIDVFNRALNAVATDPATGKLDIDRVTNVSSAQSRNMADSLLTVIKQVAGDSNVAREEAVFMKMSEMGFDGQKVRRAIDTLLREGKLISPKNGLLKVM